MSLTVCPYYGHYCWFNLIGYFKGVLGPSVSSWWAKRIFFLLLKHRRQSFDRNLGAEDRETTQSFLGKELLNSIEDTTSSLFKVMVFLSGSSPWLCSPIGATLTKWHVLLQCSFWNCISLMIRSWKGNAHSFKDAFFMFHSKQMPLIQYWCLQLHREDFKGNSGISWHVFLYFGAYEVSYLREFENFRWD